MSLLKKIINSERRYLALLLPTKPLKTHSGFNLPWDRVRCGSVVERSLIVRWSSDRSLMVDPLSDFSFSQGSTTGVTKIVVCVILSVGEYI